MTEPEWVQGWSRVAHARGWGDKLGETVPGPLGEVHAVRSGETVTVCGAPIAHVAQEHGFNPGALGTCSKCSDHVREAV